MVIAVKNCIICKEKKYETIKSKVRCIINEQQNVEFIEDKKVHVPTYFNLILMLYVLKRNTRWKKFKMYTVVDPINDYLS